MYPAIPHEGAGPRTITNNRSAFGSKNASRTLTRFRDRWTLACNALRCGAVVDGVALGLCEPDDVEAEEGVLVELLDGLAAVPWVAGCEGTVTVVEVVG